MSSARRVTVAVRQILTRDGRTHMQGATVALPDAEARDLIRAGRVREAAPEPPRSPVPDSGTSERKKNG